VEYPFVLCIGHTGGIMVYTFMNYDDFNSEYNDILKIATCYSENFSFFTVRQMNILISWMVLEIMKFH
jgi:hypothetical protein